MMRKERKLFFNLILAVIIAVFCNMLFCSNFVAYAKDNEKPDNPTVIEDVWNGEKEKFELSDKTKVNSELNPYLITNSKKLAYLADEVNNGNTYENEYFKLTSHLNLNAKFNELGILEGQSWTSIGYYSNTTSKPFMGNFDGNGYRIYNLGFNNQVTYDKSYGLFGYTKNANIKNLSISGEIKISSSNVAILVGMAEDTNIFDCSADGSISGGNTNIGVLCGDLITNKDVTIKNCKINVYILNKNSGSSVAGGIGAILNNSGKLNVSNITVSGEINGSGNVAGISNVISSIDAIKFEDCINSAEIIVESTNNVAGILGFNTNARIEKCINYGNIKALSSENVAGIVSQNSGVIFRCENKGLIYGHNNVAGIAAISKGEILNCVNYSTIKGNDNVAGIVSILEGGKNNKIFKCNYNLAVIEGNNNVSGLINEASNVEIKYCFNSIDNNLSIKGNDNVAGILSKALNCSVSSVYNKGNIESNINGAGLFNIFESNNGNKTIEYVISIGSVKGINVSGVANKLEKINLKNGYVISKLINRTNDISKSGSVVGTYSMLDASNFYYDNESSEFSQSGQKEPINGITSGTKDEIAYNFGVRGNFYIYNNTDKYITSEYYYDYLPIIRNLYFDIYNSSSDNYFYGKESEVTRLVLENFKNNKYKSIKVEIQFNNGQNNSVFYVRQNADIKEYLPEIKKEGFDFIGWYTDENFSTPLDLNDPLKNDVKVFAKFDYPKFEINWGLIIGISCFVVVALVVVWFIVSRKKMIIFKGADEKLEPLKIKVGSKIILPTPKKEKYNFVGWYYNEELTKKFDLEIMPNISLVLYAKFEEKKKTTRKRVKKEDSKDESSKPKKVTSKKKTSKKEDDKEVKDNKK